MIGHFALNGNQILRFGELFGQWCEDINGILNNWYCGGNACENRDLSLLQLGSGGLTSNPPSGDPVDSICSSGNITCEGFPELFSYYKYVFLLNNKD